MTNDDKSFDFDDEYGTDDDEVMDSDYITCSVCGMVMLRSSDLRAVNHHCCQDCYYEEFWESDNVRFSSAYFE